MPQANVVADATATEYPPLGGFLADIAGIEATTDPIDRKRRSRDFFWYSPILYDLLKDKIADIVVTPRHEAEVVRVAAACAKHRVPLTVRGGATGNYGQCVPMRGGVVLDMELLNRIEWQSPGLVRV
jgi:FAD/FMN-containing dehydrogenase